MIYPDRHDDVIRIGYSHPNLSGAQNVLGAGELVIDTKTGQVVHFNNRSGHYLPSGDRFYGYMENLMKEQGINAHPNIIVGRL